MIQKSKDPIGKIQMLQAQISPYSHKDPRFREIAGQLRNIETIIQSGKIALQVVCSDPARFEPIIEAFRRNELIASICQIFVSPLPQMGSLDQSLLLPRLRLQLFEQDTSFFPLDVHEQCQIGRAADCHIRIPDWCTLVSGHHSHLKYDQSSRTWQVQDISRNGTFVNGRRLELNECCRLQTGDRMILGDEDFTEKSPQLVFDNPEDISNLQINTQWKNFDLVYFLYDYSHSFPLAEKQILESFKALVSKSDIYAILDIKRRSLSDSDSVIKDFRSFKGTLKDKLKIDTGLSSPNSSYCFSDFLYPQAEQDENVQNLNKDFDSFLEKLQEKLGKRRYNLLNSRLESQVSRYQKVAETFLKNEQEIASTSSNKKSSDDDQSMDNQVSCEIKEAIKKIHSRKEDIFKEVQSYLKFAEDKLFDNLYANSLPCNLQTFSQQLKPHVDKVKNKKILQLRLTLSPEYGIEATSESNDSGHPSSLVIPANAAMLQFCKDELYQWAENLWLNIHSNLGEASLEHLFYEISSILTEISYLDAQHLQEKLSRRELAIDVEAVFENAFTQISDEVAIREPSAISYLLKKIRSQWMQFIFLFSFFSILGIAGRRQIMRNIMAPIIEIFGNAPLISSIVLICLVLFGIKLGIGVYQEELNEGRNKQANELRAKLCKHYQELAKKHLSKPFFLAVKRRVEEEQKRIEALQFFLENQIKQRK